MFCEKNLKKVSPELKNGKWYLINEKYCRNTKFNSIEILFQ